jgi:hypothetical protein
MKEWYYTIKISIPHQSKQDLPFEHDILRSYIETLMNTTDETIKAVDWLEEEKTSTLQTSQL